LQGTLRADIGNPACGIRIPRQRDFAEGFVLVPKRRRVGQALNGRFRRRLPVERLPQVAEAMIRRRSVMRFAHASTA
jgi:hypothetical protein